MPQVLSDIWNSAGIRYVGATLVGFLVAFGVEQLVSHLERRRLLEAVREALAEEVIDNLIVLDGYQSSFTKQFRQNNIAFTWPVARPRTAMLERCLDASIIVALTRSEQSYAALSYYQLVSLYEEMSESYEDIKGNVSLKHVRMQELLQNLPVIAQNLLNLLIEVLVQQRDFASDRSNELAARIAPIIHKNQVSSLRSWHTSNVAEDRRSGAYYLAWSHDSTDWPESITVIELKPSEGAYSLRQVNRHRLWSRIAASARRVWPFGRE